jgi:hypothetical protein
MAIDVNEEVTVWGGFSPEAFWGGAVVLVLLAAVAILIGMKTSPWLGGISFFMGGGSLTGVMIHAQRLPKGYLGRRFRREGRFLFLKIPGVGETGFVAARSAEAFTRFRAHLEDGHGPH